ncbi:Crinkler (CRN), partial [Phytophthora megakarya]
VIIRECAGHIGALRIFIDSVVKFFEKTPPQQQEVLAFCFSETVVQAMGPLYGRRHVIPSDIEFQTFLIKCLLDDSMPLPMQYDERSCFIRLMKTGIIARDAKSFVKFTSPLATRYYFKYLFPKRGHHNPSSLNELIRKVIGNMSARVLMQSTVDKNDFPNEATFKHQFMEGLALWTESTCSICPELSKVFPALPNQPSQHNRGEIDFYLDGSLRWGIELLVNGDKIGEHMSQFAPKGKYAALAAEAYAVIDFRGNKTGESTNVARIPERITVFFKLGDFSSCRCIFGLAEDAEPITLNH